MSKFPRSQQQELPHVGGGVNRMLVQFFLCIIKVGIWRKMKQKKPQSVCYSSTLVAGMPRNVEMWGEREDQMIFRLSMCVKWWFMNHEICVVAFDNQLWGKSRSRPPSEWPNTIRVGKTNFLSSWTVHDRSASSQKPEGIDTAVTRLRESITATKFSKIILSTP